MIRSGRSPKAQITLPKAGDGKRVAAQLHRVAREIGAVNYLPAATLERAALAELEGDFAAREAHLRAALTAFERIDATFRVEQIHRLLHEARNPG